MSYPNPILNLNFANAKQLVHPAVDFTRTGSAYTCMSNGLFTLPRSGAPRFHHNPLTGESLGLMVERARSNLLPYSESFSTWVNDSKVTAGARLGPDGTMSMALLTDDSTTADSIFIDKTVTITSNANSQCLSFYLARGTAARSVIMLYLSGGTTISGGVSVLWGDTPTVVATDAAWTNPPVATTTGRTLSPGIEDCGGGIYRVKISFANNNTGNTTAICRIYPAGGEVGVTGTVYACWAQLEEGTDPTQYILTTSAAVAVGGDIASVDLTKLRDNTGRSLWARTEGTVVVDFTTGERVDVFQLLNIGTKESWSNRIAVYTVSGSFWLLASAASDSFHDVGVSVLKNTRYKAIISFTSTEYWISLNGVNRGGNLHTMPQGMPHIILSRSVLDYQFGGCIGQLQVYNRAVSKADAPALSAI